MIRSFVHRQLLRLGNGAGLSVLRDQVTECKLLSARILADALKSRGIVDSLQEVEFKVFSQFGDDGIIQYLIHNLRIPSEQREFVEFGVENYDEANTRFLLMNDNWRGLVMDSDPRNIRHIRRSAYYWKHELSAVAAFIDRDNIDSILQDNGFSGELGLLSIDIDGNDYWVWERISVVEPVIVVVEYNSAFGSELAVTIPYDSTFLRTRAHHSNLYWGCSLKALCTLANQKGYAFVGCNSAGNNAYFVRRDHVGPVKSVTVEEGYVYSRFRESRNAKGELTYLSGDARLMEIAELPIYDIEHDRTLAIGEMFANILSNKH